MPTEQIQKDIVNQDWITFQGSLQLKERIGFAASQPVEKIFFERAKQAQRECQFSKI